MMKNRHKTRLLQLIYFGGFFALLILGDALWITLGLFGYVFFETFAGNIALHRYFGHASFKTRPWCDKILLYLGHYIGVGSVLSWTAQHRYHHQHSDTPLDVHSPYFQGLMKIFFGQWHLQVGPSLVRDLVRRKDIVFWHKNYYKFHFAISLFWLSLDVWLGTYLWLALYCFPNFLCLMSGYVLATLTHWHGYRSYETKDFSTNSWIANVLTLGEGWHNNHHAHPQRLQQGEKKHEWDLPAFVVQRWLMVED